MNNLFILLEILTLALHLQIVFFSFLLIKILKYEHSYIDTNTLVYKKEGPFVSKLLSSTNIYTSSKEFSIWQALNCATHTCKWVLFHNYLLFLFTTVSCLPVLNMEICLLNQINPFFRAKGILSKFSAHVIQRSHFDIWFCEEYLKENLI